MPTLRPQRVLLEEAAFIARLETVGRSLNQRFSTNLLVDANRARQAHQEARDELAIALDTTNQDELFEAFDMFVYILVERLINGVAFSHAFSATNDRRESLRDLIQRFPGVLGPMIVVEDMMRWVIFNLTEITAPTFFREDNLAAVKGLCRAIEADPSEARNYLPFPGYPPLVER